MQPRFFETVAGLGSGSGLHLTEKAEMAAGQPASIFKKLGADRERMLNFGITDSVMVTYYTQAGAGAANKKRAFDILRTRFGLSDEDAAFVRKVLDNCSPY